MHLDFKAIFLNFQEKYNEYILPMPSSGITTSTPPGNSFNDLPEDFEYYLKNFPGYIEGYDQNGIRFLNFNEVGSLDQIYWDWEGSPNYSLLLKDVPAPDDYLVFAEELMHLSSFALCINRSNEQYESVFKFSGDGLQKITGSFSEFIYLYLNDSDILE